MLHLDLLRKISVAAEDIPPVSCKSHSILFLNPSTMKALEVEKNSTMLVRTSKGPIVMKCWPQNNLPTSAAAFHSLLFEHYINSTIEIECLQSSILPAKIICLCPKKYKTFMSSAAFQTFVVNELYYVYIRENLVLTLNYLGYTCCFKVEKVEPDTQELEKQNFEESQTNELTNMFSEISINSEKSKVEHEKNSFLKDLKAAQTSTPLSTHKMPIKTATKKSNSESLMNVSIPQEFYFFNDLTKVVINKETSKLIKFKDLIGLDECIDFIKSTVDSILHPTCEWFHLSTPAVLLIGPQGSGKSIIGKAIKNEFSFPVHIINFKNINSSDDKEMDQLKLIFENSDKCSPCIIFLDDLDNLFLEKESSVNFEKTEFFRNLTSLIYTSLNHCSNIMIFATVQNRNSLPSHFLKNEFFTKEFTIAIPSCKRKKVFLHILDDYCHNLSDDNINEVIELTSVYTYGQLQKLCEKARDSKHMNLDTTDNFVLDLEDIKLHLQQIESAVLFNFETPNVRWTDIGGMQKVKEAIIQMVDWPLRLAHQFKKFKIPPPRGILMHGPPGCCKTMIVKALVTESNLNLISVKGSELFNKYVGESERTVSELFKKARSSAPCVLFFDEIDSMTSTRGSITGNSNVCDRVITQLLIEIDGIETLEGVSILAATNRPDIIDPSFLRPGRFDRRIYVPLPDENTRQEIFNVKLQRLPISEDVSSIYLAQATEGYSGAEISEICLEATRYALLEGASLSSIITMTHFHRALQVVLPKTNEETKKFFENYEKQIS